MNFELLFQLLTLGLIVLSGPVIVGVLATQEENGL
jgi:Photosystem II complex subunit Ycf12